MSQKKLFVETYGCQMNVDDSLRMGKLLEPLNYGLTLIPEEADLILINTCSVREKASHKAHSAIGRYYKVKAIKPNTLMGLTGCQAQAEGKSLLKKFHYLDFVMGPDQMAQLPSIVKNLEEGKSKSIDGTQRIKPQDFKFVQLHLNSQENPASAFVTIMKGCDNFCSFCIVPFVRGREVSRPSDEIIAEVQALCDRGVKEVTLLGQNVNSYGSKNTGEISFSKLLYRIANETTIQRLRFTTSHPKDVGEDLAIAFKEIDVLAKHLHLPVQSGSNRVLEKMYRTYTREEYLKIIRQLREQCPEIALSTDIIIGFPGETDDDFEHTLSLLDEVQFDFAFSFNYSPRPHTTAGRYFEDDVSQAVKEKRLHLLQEKQLKKSYELNQNCVGSTYVVLVEGPSKMGETLQGRSSQNRIIHFPIDPAVKVGDFVKVKVTKATPTSLVGESVP